MNHTIKIFLAGLVLALNMSAIGHAENKINFSKKYYSFSFNSIYQIDHTEALGNDPSNSPIASSDIKYPEQSIWIGATAAISFNLGGRWAFRPVLGYQYRMWWDDPDTSQYHPLDPEYHHSLEAALLFDIYFNSNSRWHTYLTAGPGISGMKPELMLGFGTHYELTKRLNLDFEIKGGTMLLWWSVEPTVGISVNY